MSQMLDDEELPQWVPEYDPADKLNIWAKSPPDDAPFPRVQSFGFEGGSPTSPFRAKEIVAYSLSRRIRWYDFADRDETILENIGLRIRNIYHDNDFTISGGRWTAINVEAEWPTSTPTSSDEMMGQRLTVSFSISEGT